MMDSLELSRSLKEKLNLLKNYLTQTERLEDGIGLQEPSTLMELLERRQLLIQETDRIDGRIGAGMEEAPSGNINSCGKPGETIRLLSKAIEDVLQQIKATDERCMRRLTSRHQEVKQEVAEKSHGLKAIHCYRGRPARPPKFIDVNR
jgi:uncharacterized protein YicC (UPF0701 family)